MESFNPNRVQKALFRLLQLGLNNSEPGAIDSLFRDITKSEWENCYRLAVGQGVKCIAWDGVLKLPKEVHPPLSLKLKWALSVEKYEGVYRRYCIAAHQLGNFFKENGIAMVQFKGVGLSPYYPVPQHREGGDIDIYICPDSNCDNLKASDYADELIRQSGIKIGRHSYKHTNFVYNGVPIENHKYFVNVEEYKYGGQVDEILKSSLAPCCCALLDGELTVNTPSLAFNSLYIPFHAFQHYGCGLALHHLCDWACIIAQGGLETIPEEVTDRKFLLGIAAFTFLSNEILGSRIGMWSSDGGVGASLCNGRMKGIERESVERLAKRMLQEMLEPRYSNRIPAKGRLYALIYKWRRLVHRYNLSGDIFEYSLLKKIRRFVTPLE